jgi:hypothetical protein
MNPAGKLLAYFYAFVLSLWSITIPHGDESFIHFTQEGKEISSEKIDSIGQPDNYFLFSSGPKTFASSTPVDHLSHLTHIFYEKAFQFKYLKALFATTFSFLEGIDIEFKFIDGIFPFHFFW